MSINVLNDFKQNGNPKTTITYCIDTTNLNDHDNTDPLNKNFRNRGGDPILNSQNSDSQQRQNQLKPRSSFKALFRSPSEKHKQPQQQSPQQQNHNSSQKELNNKELKQSISMPPPPIISSINFDENSDYIIKLRRFSSDEIEVVSFDAKQNNLSNVNGKIERTRSLKANQLNSYSYNNKTNTNNNNNDNNHLKVNKQPLNRSKSLNRPNSKKPLSTQNSSPITTTSTSINKNFLSANSLSKSNSNSDNQLKSNEDINKKPGFIKRLSVKFRKSKKAPKTNQQEPEQLTADQRQQLLRDSVQLNIESK